MIHSLVCIWPNKPEKWFKFTFKNLKTSIKCIACLWWTYATFHQPCIKLQLLLIHMDHIIKGENAWEGESVKAVKDKGSSFNFMTPGRLLTCFSCSTLLKSRHLEAWPWEIATGQNRSSAKGETLSAVHLVRNWPGWHQFIKSRYWWILRV